MKDAFGGVLNIVIVVIFLVIVSGILGLLVNYSKAFKMKNVIISSIEQYEGSKSCFSTKATGTTPCQEKILDDAKNIGYNPTALHCHDGYEKSNGLFCYKKYDSMGSADSSRVVDGYYYTIVTQVDINIPIINDILGLSIFQVHGDTRVIK